MILHTRQMLENKITIKDIGIIIFVMSNNVQFYILVMFLIVIKSVSSYDDSDEAPRFRRSGNHLKEDPRWKRDRQRRNSMRLEYDYDKVPVDFDVASFIKADDDSVENDQELDHHNDILRETNDYDYDALTNQDAAARKSDELPDEELTRHLIKNSLDNLNVDMLGMGKLDTFKNPYMENTAHNAEKKSALKKVSLPFFSHKNDLPNASFKKEKKRKLFNFRKFSKKKAEKVAKVKSSQTPDKVTHLSQAKTNKIKRSYIQRLCPKCKKKFLDNWHMKRRKKKNNNNKVKEIYQNLPDEQLNENNMVTRRIEENEENVEYRREKRSGEIDARVRDMEKREEIRERQLKELDEVQKEIDEVEIHIPQVSASRSKKSE